MLGVVEVVRLHRGPWEVVVEPPALSLLVVEAEAQGHGSAERVGRFFGLRRVEAHQISVQPAFLLRWEPSRVVGEEGVPVEQSASYHYVRAFQHRPVVEAHRISVLAVKAHVEKQVSRPLLQTFSVQEEVVGRLVVLPEAAEVL